jgi:hypothetical protein
MYVVGRIPTEVTKILANDEQPILLTKLDVLLEQLTGGIATHPEANWTSFHFKTSQMSFYTLFQLLGATEDPNQITAYRRLVEVSKNFAMKKALDSGLYVAPEIDQGDYKDTVIIPHASSRVEIFGLLYFSISSVLTLWLLVTLLGKSESQQIISYNDIALALVQSLNNLFALYLFMMRDPLADNE